MSASEVRAYLEDWHTRRDQWKFKKLVQQQLIECMYDPNKLSKSEFGVAVEYLAGLQGKARERVLHEANLKVEQFEGKQERGEEVGEEERRAVKRAVKLLEGLSA
jgi:hypothetical protein